MSGTTTPEPGVAAFDYAAWSVRYPDLAVNVSATLAGAYFTEAGLYLNNTPQSIVQDLPTRLLLLNMLVAHIAQLNLSQQQGGTGVVGRVAQATRGSVSVATDIGPTPGTAAWFYQTQAGLSFWQATARFRQMRFVPGFSPRPRIWP